MTKTWIRPSIMLGIFAFIVTVTLIVAVTNPAARLAFAAALDGWLSIPQPAAATAMPADPAEPAPAEAPTSRVFAPQEGTLSADVGATATLTWRTTGDGDCNWSLDLLDRGVSASLSGLQFDPCDLNQLIGDIGFHAKAGHQTGMLSNRMVQAILQIVRELKTMVP